MGQKGNGYEVLLGKPEIKRQLVRHTLTGD
jgi:hypothetical protein